MKRILALVDDSVYAESVADHAAWLGRRTAAAIDVVHVLDPVDPARTSAGMAALAIGGPGIVAANANYSPEKLEELTLAAQALVDRMCSRIAADYAGVVVGRVIVDALAEGVTLAQEDVDAVVVGKRGESADFVRLTLGSSMRNIVSVATSPILITPRVYRAIAGWIIAVDEESTVLPGVTSLMDSDLLPDMPCEIIHIGNADRLLKTDIQSLQRLLTAHGFFSSVNLLPGDPVRVLAERLATDETKLLAVGKFGRARLLPMLFGDGVAQDLTRASLGPVLVLKQHPASLPSA